MDRRRNLLHRHHLFLKHNEDSFHWLTACQSTDDPTPRGAAPTTATHDLRTRARRRPTQARADVPNAQSKGPRLRMMRHQQGRSALSRRGASAAEPEPCSQVSDRSPTALEKTPAKLGRSDHRCHTPGETLPALSL
jgi:hypothetical protein